MFFRRKMTLPAVSVLCSIFAYEVPGPGVAFAIAACSFLGFFLFMCKGNGYRAANLRGLFPALALLLMWVTPIHLAIIDSAPDVLRGMEDETVRIEGRVLNLQQRKKDDEERLVLQVEAESAKDPAKAEATLLKRERILISCPAQGLKGDSGLAPGDRIEATGKIRLPDPGRNPNTFDYAGYLRTKRIYTTMYTEAVGETAPPSGSIKARLYRSKTCFVEELERHAGSDTADIMRAILFGDKGCLDDDIYETFQMNGTAHILAVSGLHVGMVYALILALWNRLGRLVPGSGGRRGWGFLAGTGLFLIMYAALSGFAPSVVRAVLMILLHIYATMTGRYYDLKSVTLAVFTATLAVDPLMLLQSGFQMSFLAILSIAIVLPYLRHFLTGAVLAGASVQLGLMPYIMYQFNWLTLLSIPVNVPVVFIAGLIVPLGMVSFLLTTFATIVDSAFAALTKGHEAAIAISGGLVEKTTGIIDGCVGILCDMMVSLNRLCCFEGITALRVCSPPAWLLILFYLALVAFASESGRLMIKRSGRRLIAPIAVTILVIAVIAGSLIDEGYGKMNLVFVDVGQGDCMHIRVKDGPQLPGGRILGIRTKNYLIDGGGDDDYEVGTKTLKPYLLKNGVRTIDGAFVSHLHTDHYRGICELAREGMVKRIFVYEANRLRLREICDETGLSPDRIMFLRAGHSVNLGPGPAADPSRQEPVDSGTKQIRQEPVDSLQVLWPPSKTEADYAEMTSDEEDENASSLIMRVVLDGVSVLATGDMGEDGEREVIAFARAWPDPPQQGEGSAIRADILKVGHHGSKYSTCDEFLDAVSPELAVIQVGKGNTYGHPTPEVLARLADRDIPVYRNDAQGAVGFRIRDGKIKEVKTMIK